MKVGEIEKMLDEFYEGKTTEEQEDALREYFETEVVPEQFKLEQEIFMNCRRAIQVDVPAGLEKKLIQLIDEKAIAEKRFMIKNRTVFNWKRMGGFAAGILLVAGLAYSIINLRKGHLKDTFTDPMEAYNEMQAVLYEVSSNMNDAIARWAEVREDANNINQEIIEEIQ